MFFLVEMCTAVHLVIESFDATANEPSFDYPIAFCNEGDNTCGLAKDELRGAFENAMMITKRVSTVVHGGCQLYVGAIKLSDQH